MKKSRELRTPVAVRLPEGMILQIDAMAARRGIDRSTLLFEMLEKGFLQLSMAEISAKIIEKLDAEKRSDHAVFAALDDINDRLSIIELAIKK